MPASHPLGMPEQVVKMQKENFWSGVGDEEQLRELKG